MKRKCTNSKKAAFDAVGHYEQDLVNGLRESTLDNMLALLKLNEATSVLDAMGGNGNLTKRLFSYCELNSIEEPSVTMLEFSEVQADFARMELHQTKAKIVRGDAVKMQNLDTGKLFPDASFDRVMIKSANHEIPLSKQRELYSNILRVLKPGGLFVNLGFLFDDPREREEFREIARVKDFCAKMDDAAQNRYFLTREELYRSLEDVGFYDISCGELFEYKISSKVVAEQYFSGSKSLHADLEHQAAQAKAFHMRQNNRIQFNRAESLMICPGELTVARKPEPVEENKFVFNDYPYDFLRKIEAHVKMLKMTALNIPQGSNVLDLCCGLGLLAEHLTQKDCTYKGIDLSAEFIAACRERFADYRSFSFQELDVNSFPAEENRYDRIALLNALYLPGLNVNLLLKKALQSLKPSGRIIISGPVSSSSYEQAEPNILKQLEQDGLLKGNEGVLKAIRQANEKLLKQHGNYWSAEGMAELLLTHGFSSVSFLDTTLYYGASFMVIAEK